MKRRMWLAGALAALLLAAPAKADTGVIIRTTGGLPVLQVLCLLPTTCTVVGALDGTVGQVFLVTTPLPLQTFLGLLPGLTGFVDAEVNQVLNLVGGLNLLPAPIPSTLMSDRSSVPYGGTNVWNSYANQTATGIVEVQTAQTAFNVTGTGVVADIDTGVDPGHPALQGVLLAGYDFTRNQPGGSEMTDLNPSDFPTFPPQSCATCQPATVNQSTAAVLDQSTAAVLDGSPYTAFGHGTMVMGIIHLVAPTAQLLPLKAFHADGTAALSDILRAIYYGVQNGANAINMSFDIKTSSTELQKALDYANQQGVMCAASAGNDGMQEIVYPAALQSDVMGVASTSDQDTRSSFSNYGNAIVWVAAPGDCEYVSILQLCGGMGNLVQRAVCIGRGSAAAQPENHLCSVSSRHCGSPCSPACGFGHGQRSAGLVSDAGGSDRCELSPRLQRFCHAFHRDHYGGTAGELHRFRYATA